jgi:putative FmdB family regulatory protein
MPLYEYHCMKCGAEFEMIRRFSESGTLPVCPQCESPQTQKKLSTIASFGMLSSASVGSPSVGCGSSAGFS